MAGSGSRPDLILLGDPDASVVLFMRRDLTQTTEIDRGLKGGRSHVEKLLTIIKVPEPRGKILFTVLCLVAFLAIYRIGFFIPLPIVNQTP